MNFIRFVVAACLMGQLWAQNSAPQKPAPVPPYALNTTGFQAPGFFFAMRNGKFGNIELKTTDILFTTTYRNYVYAYGESCASELPKDPVELLRQVCVEPTRKITRRQDGMIVSDEPDCNRFETRKTGVFADPRFAKYYYLSPKKAMTSLTDAMANLFNPNALLGTANDIQKLSSDIHLLFSQNSCKSPDVKIFSENLLRFAAGNEPLQIAAGETATPTLYSGCVANKPKGRTDDANWNNWCSCIDRQYQNVLTPEEKERYTRDYVAFDREALSNSYGKPGFEYRLYTPQNACKH